MINVHREVKSVVCSVSQFSYSNSFANVDKYKPAWPPYHWVTLHNHYYQQTCRGSSVAREVPLVPTALSGCQKARVGAAAAPPVPQFPICPYICTSHLAHFVLIPEVLREALPSHNKELRTLFGILKPLCSAYLR